MPLRGMRVVVLGAAGEVGEGVVRQALHHHAEVIAVSRSVGRLDGLRARLTADASLAADAVQRLLPIVAPLDSEAGYTELARQLTPDAHRPTSVVASLGGWRQGPSVVETSMEAWHEALNQSLTAHVLAARAFLPLVANEVGGSYTLVNGGAATRPAPGAAAMAVSAAGQLMLMQALALEHQRDAVRINTLLLDTPVRTRSRPSGSPSWITADDAGAGAAYLAAPGTTRRGHVLVLDGPAARAELGAPFA